MLSGGNSEVGGVSEIPTPTPIHALHYFSVYVIELLQELGWNGERAAAETAKAEAFVNAMSAE